MTPLTSSGSSQTSTRSVSGTPQCRTVSMILKDRHGNRRCSMNVQRDDGAAQDSVLCIATTSNFFIRDCLDLSPFATLQRPTVDRTPSHSLPRPPSPACPCCQHWQRQHREAVWRLARTPRHLARSCTFKESELNRTPDLPLLCSPTEVGLEPGHFMEDRMRNTPVRFKFAWRC